MSSRLSHRTKKQEKFKRHIASLTSEASKDESTDKSEDRNVMETSSRSEPYNPIKQKIRYVVSVPSEESNASKEEPTKTDFKARYRNRIADASQRRTGRSLTRASSDGKSRSSSTNSQASSNNSQEPGKITARPRPGRSLTRASSIDSRGQALPTSRSLSINSTGKGVNSTDEQQSARAPSATRAKSLSGDPVILTTRSNGGDSSKTANSSSSTVRPLSRRSPFTKLLAEKKANIGSVKRKPKVIPNAASTVTAKAVAVAAKGSSSSAADATKAQEETTVEPLPLSTDVSTPKEDISTATDETDSAPDDEKMFSAESKEEEPPVVEAVDESEELPSSDDVNLSVLSQENIEKHTSSTDNEEYLDPPLEEMESEITVATDLENRIKSFELSQSILSTLCTSPVHEVTSPTHEVTSPAQESTSPIHEVSSPSQEISSPVQEVTSPVHEITSPVHEVASPVHEAKEDSADVDNSDNKQEDQQEEHINDETIDVISEENKVADENEETASPAETAKAWELSNPEFSKFSSSKDESKKEDFHPEVFGEDAWEPGIDTKFSESSGVKAAKSSTSAPLSNEKKSDILDVFDTSSWVAGTVTDFSNTSFPKFEMDIKADRNFVNMMKEEMKFRSLTEEEQKMMFEANEKINQAEEKAHEALTTIQKGDEPLIVKRSDPNSVEGSEANTAVSLEDRLKMYADVEPDEDSLDSSDESDDEDSSDEEDEMRVEYVDQNNEDEEPAKGEISATEAPINLVASNDVPTLEIAASAASASSAQEPNESSQSNHNDSNIDPTNDAEASSPKAPVMQEAPSIPRTLSELKLSSPPPPPPPPGLPKKKKKKSKSKTKSRNKKSIPLLTPPSKEKLKNWKGDPQKAQDYVSAMADRLADTTTKTLDASSEYFHFKHGGESKDEESKHENLQVPIDNESASEEPKTQTSLSNDAQKDIAKVEGAQEEDQADAIPGSDSDLVLHDVVSPKTDKDHQSIGLTEEPPPQDVENDTEQAEEDSHGEDQADEELEDDSVSAFAKKVQRENEQTVSLHTEKKNNLWRKEVANAIGLVDRLQEEYEKEEYPELAMFPSPLSDEDQGPTVSAPPSASQDSKDLAGEDIENQNDISVPEIKQNKTSDSDCSSNALQHLLSVDTQASPTRTPRQESLFVSPKSVRSPKPGAFNDKTKRSSSNGSIVIDSKMADKVALASSAAANTFEQTFTPRNSSRLPKEYEFIAWFSKEVLNKAFTTQASEVDVSTAAHLLLEDNNNFNSMCRIVAESVNEVSIELKPGLRSSPSIMSSFDGDQLMSKTLSTVQSGLLGMGNSNSMSTNSGDSDDKSTEHQRILLNPVVLSDASVKLSSKYLAANFVSFLFMASKLTKVPSPFGDSNPFLAMIVESPLETIGVQNSPKSTQELVSEQLDGKVEKLFEFVYKVKTACDAKMKVLTQKPEDSALEVDQTCQSIEEPEIPSIVRNINSGKRFIVPECHPSPFEKSVLEAPRIVAAVLSFLGDPVAICRIQKVNRSCRRIVSENEHTMMQDAVRGGGLEARHRPAFWIHVALEKSDVSSRENFYNGLEEMNKVELSAEEGKWHHVIKRDVDRSFGNMPPHKTNATFQKDSIVTALVTWGQNRLMKRGVKGGGEPIPTPEIGENNKKVKRKATNISSPPWTSDEVKENGSIENDASPTHTVSDWGAVSPKGSFVGSVNDSDDRSSMPVDSSMEEIALCGNSLSADAKADLQNKLSYILHTLAATYEDIGYCQGMDYVVAHLLRNLQDTIRCKAVNKNLPAIISTASTLNVTEDIESMNKDIDSNRIVEETIVRVMDTFFVNYNLKHMYWPELRCLKTCCRVFEKLIQIKLPVLADHFEHHDLNVGLFALGWFQTLFLYLPSMPSATVCHMWDIWLVERSFKIFFRVGTAILFLSQPILLNHELEGMMTYLNTIPDATLLRPDILIPCALNIKVTNRLLQELEDDVMNNPN